MTHLRADDAAFERDLRRVLAGIAPDAAPASLRAAVAGVAARPARRGTSKGRGLIAVVGLAAVVVIGVASIGLLVGPRELPPGGGTPVPGDVPSVPASPSPGQATLTFRVLTPDGSLATKPQIDAVATVMEARLRAFGIGNFSSAASDDRITFDIPMPEGTSISELRDLLGATGVLSIALLGASPVNPGAPVHGSPLLSDNAFTDARVGTDQTGAPTLDLAIDAQAAGVFADVTRTHVGDYLALVLDGVAISVPVIRQEIPDGRLQFSFPTGDATAARLAAILEAGLAVSLPGPDQSRLPLPVEQVTP
ncbi:MAG TPA: hypothetical protein VGM28_07305 [Candidatus Limnocylindrales bacterium]|jgi:hypothetical protein